MLERLAADTSVIVYLMTAFGVLGIISKMINYFTLRRLVKAASNMPKSTHRLIKLVRAKYEHACMIHDSVENTGAFVDKYIYEYRGVLLRIHTWRQFEILSVWFSGILAVLGAALCYLYSGLNESVYQYIAGGAAEIILLSVVMRLSDEEYAVNAVKMYMVDYLDNICVFRLKRQRQNERESIDVISEGGGKTVFEPVQEGRERGRSSSSYREESVSSGYRREISGYDQEAVETKSVVAGQSFRRDPGGSGKKEYGKNQENYEETDPSLAINIEGEPRRAGKKTTAEQLAGKAVNTQNEDGERPVVREEAIRQILEEFLA